ncbi:MAG: right-handed parallel beta-helix repeat-containing protein [Planctomycetota bacterium]|jgi:parallel beta-helix repeat protein
MNNSTNLKIWLVMPIFVLALYCNTVAAGDVIYVDVNGSNDPGTGSYEDPFRRIQTGIDDASDGDTVIVADGTYTGAGDRDIDLLGKAITVRSENEPENCVIDCQGSGSEPHRGFIFQNQEGQDSILDGFTIRNGYEKYNGGAILCQNSSPVIRNCIIKNNHTSNYGGAGICCENNSNPMIEDCKIIDNESEDHGGGISCDNSSPTIRRCTIKNNGTTDGHGGGISCEDSSNPTITNCLILGNHLSSDCSGGGIYCSGSNPTITNCIIAGNLGDGGGGIHCFGGSPIITNCTIAMNAARYSGGGMWNRWYRIDSHPTLTNCILWGNTANSGPQIYNGDTSSATIRYSDVQGSYSGTGNINADPLFVDQGFWDDNGTPSYFWDDSWIEGNFHLLGASPCINAGDPNGSYAGQTDIDGEPRVLDGRVDMGAYEYYYDPVIIYVDENAAGANNGTSWLNAFVDLQEGLAIAQSGDEIWVAQGTYYPSELTDPCDPRSATFQLIDGVALYGGFAGTEDPCTFDLDDRDFATNESVLSGDLDADDVIGGTGTAIPADNCGDSEPIFIGFTYEGSTEGATNDGSSTCSPSSNTQDVWYVYTPTVDRSISISTTGSSLSISVHSDCPGSKENELACSNPPHDDASLNVIVGNTYYIRVSQLYSYNPVSFVMRLMSNGENCYHVVTGSGTNETAILNGFTVTGGYANVPRYNSSEEWPSNSCGGGIYNQSSSPTVTKCTFRANFAIGDGGGMANRHSSRPIVTNCTFYGNFSGDDGGGMYSTIESNAVIMNSVFNNNHTGDNGGGVYFSKQSNVTISGCTFTENTASMGGGVYCQKVSSPLVTNNTISSNSSIWRGGGIGCEDSSLFTIQSNIITANTSGGVGGGIYTDNSELNIIENIITSNTANSRGGGIWVDDSTANISKNTFKNNHSNGDGGGIYGNSSSSRLNICENTIMGNSSNDDGGGIWIDQASLKINSNIISDNHANDNGGGIYIRDIRSNAPSIITGNLISGNIGEDGGGIWCRESLSQITNNTIVENKAEDDGGGLCFRWDSTTIATNNILWGNTALNGSEIMLRDESELTVAYCNVAGGPSMANVEPGCSLIWENGNINVDPAFAELGYLDDNATPSDPSDDFWVNGDYHLQLDSPCIDAGNNSAVDPNNYTDLDGNVRILDGDRDGIAVVDMGAYEALGPVEADVHIVPRVINRNNRMKRVMATIRLPEGVGKGDVVRESFELYAGGIDVEPIGAILERVIGRGNMTRVFALFDKDEVMNAVEDVIGGVELTVVGRLESGQYIQGSDTVRIVKPRRRRPHQQAGKRKRWRRW